MGTFERFIFIVVILALAIYVLAEWLNSSCEFITNKKNSLNLIKNNINCTIDNETSGVYIKYPYMESLLYVPDKHVDAFLPWFIKLGHM